MLRAMKRGGRATVVPIVGQGVAPPVFAAILDFTGKSDPARLVWALDCADAVGLAVAAAVIPVRKLRKMVSAGGEHLLHSALFTPE
jgi:hypothetical protein